MKEMRMNKIILCVGVVGLLAISSSSVFARGGVSGSAPGTQFRTGSTTAPVQNLPGASGWSPGQQMNNATTQTGNGASVYAPGFLKNH
jgi:hypothetical protein